MAKNSSRLLTEYNQDERVAFKCIPYTALVQQASTTPAAMEFVASVKFL